MRGHIRSYELKTGKRAWAVVIYQGKHPDKEGRLRDRYRWFRGFGTQKKAQTELTRILKSLDDGIYIEPSKQTVASYLDHWLITIKPHLAGKTYERYEQIVNNNIKPRLGAIPFVKLQPIQISEFYSWALTSGRQRREGGLSARTVLHIHRCLHTALEQAVKWQLRPTNPAGVVEAPRPVQIEMKAADEDQSASLLDSVRNTPFYLPVIYALCTGLRRGEILAQRWCDVDFTLNRLFVAQALEQTKAGGVKFKIPKGKKRRPLTMPALLAEALQLHKQEQEKNRQAFGKDYRISFDLVVALPDGSPWPPNHFSGAYSDFVERIGMKGFRFHDLRHSHASQLLRQGVPVKTVQERLGHANASITLNTYAHVLGGDDQKAVDVLEERLRTAIQRKANSRVN